MDRSLNLWWLNMPGKAECKIERVICENLLQPGRSRRLKIKPAKSGLFYLEKLIYFFWESSYSGRIIVGESIEVPESGESIYKY